MSDLMTTATAVPTIVATICGPDSLHHALRARAEVVNVSRLELDRHGGFASGYSAKILAPRPLKRLSIESACALANALGCQIVLIEDADLLERITSLSPPRDPGHANHAGAVHLTFSLRHLRKIARIGGQNSRKYMSRREAKMLARKASAARWNGANQ